MENRGTGLQSFIQAYRKLTKIPTPKFETVVVSNQVERILELLKMDLERVKVHLNIQKNTQVLADRDLLDQVLINLIKNGIEAMETTDSPELLIACPDEHEITITDNGTGIDKDKLDQIFIPFFTTKKEGSGIGLALAQQIMQLHGGKIKVASKAGRGTTFRLIF